MTVRLRTGVKVGLKLCWSNFEGQFGAILEDLREHKAYVEDEAKAAAMEDGQLRFQKLEIQAEGNHIFQFYI